MRSSAVIREVLPVGAQRADPAGLGHVLHGVFGYRWRISSRRRALNEARLRVARNSVVIAGTMSTAVLTGLPGGAPIYTVRVIAANAYGDGPAATSALVTPTGAATTYASSVLAAAPSAYYRLGEASGLTTAANSSGGTSLRVRSASETWRAAGALRGDADTAVGTDGGCCVGSSKVAMPRFDAGRSLQAWVRPNDGYERWFAGYGVSGDATAFSVGLRDSAVIVHNGSVALTFSSPRPLTDGVWHQVTVTYAAKTVTAYLDGLSLGRQAVPRRAQHQCDRGRPARRRGARRQ